MEANITFSLFITNLNIEEDMDIDEPCINLIETTLLVMECCLNEESTPTSIQHFCLLEM
jgi:hypothetical protein